ncbi:hypothetical protein [Pseudomonas sp. NPDC089406]|uniref:hypothetical protein n=1 Tax=Pseudomonas sp. NPDC089406 TaxID=3364463 RepID=UPI00384DB382
MALPQCSQNTDSKILHGKVLLFLTTSAQHLREKAVKFGKKPSSSWVNWRDNKNTRSVGGCFINEKGYTYRSDRRSGK